MSIEKQVSIDEVLIAESGHVFIRETTTFVEDEEIVAKAYKRMSFAPGDNVDALPASVQAICAAAWASAASVTS
jgi:hypothetical protein